MKYRSLIALILALVILGISFNFNAADEYTKIENIAVKSENSITGGKYGIENIMDGEINTCAILTPVLNSEICIKVFEPSDITGLKLAVNYFPGWRNIKKIGISYTGEISSVLDVPNNISGVHWIEDKTFVKKVSEIKLTVLEVYDNNQSISGAIAEIELYGYGSEKKSDETKQLMPRELEYGYDMVLKANSPMLQGWEYSIARSFDKDFKTNSGMSKFKDGYIIFEFHYPTDVSKFVIYSTINGDWATAKEVEFAVYNKETKYRNKLKNPAPIASPMRYALEDRGGRQEIDLRGEDLFKGVTHLMIRFTDVYMHTNAEWGGWSELEIHGVPHKDEKPTSEIIATNLVSNTHIMCELGFVHGEATPEFMKKNPTRIEAAELILNLANKIEEAKNYEGNFNFSDAELIPKYKNILSYIYAYENFGIQGVGDNKFAPYDKISARGFYKMLLSVLGYAYNKDYTWDTMDRLLHKLGIGDMLYVDNFTMKDMCNAAYEAFTMKIKGTDILLADRLRSQGLISDEVWLMHLDKQDRVSSLDDGNYVPPEAANRDSEFSFTLSENPKVLTKLSFCYNTPFHYAGTYYGMLPHSDPLSKRTEFAEALKKAGARSLRFPGGMPAHQYFIEGEEYAKQFNKDCRAFIYNAWGGLYNHEDYNNAWYVDFYDFLDFCKEYDIEPLFQINPSFYVDEEAGRVRQVYPCFMIKKQDGEIQTMPGYYDRDRFEEAAAQLGKNIDRMIARGYTIKYWEIGNEDNFQNYSDLPLSDPNNPLTQDYLAATAAYCRVIKEKIPDAYIIATGGFPFELMDKKAYELIDSLSTHYPFGKWTIPPDDERNSAARLVGTNEQYFVHYSKEVMLKTIEEGGLPKDCTETMAWRFEGWDPNSLQHTFANALNVAHNWGELVFDAGYRVNVMHDLESPWFGFVLYDVALDTGNRYFRWTKNVSFTVHPDDIPDMYYFKEKYFFNPASKAFELLGRHYGGKVLDSSKSNVNRLVSGYASVKENKLYVTICNRLNEKKDVKIRFPNLRIRKQEVSAEILQSDYLRASLEEEYNVFKDVKIEINGNDQNMEDYAIEFQTMPYSITHFVIEL